MNGGLCRKHVGWSAVGLLVCLEGVGCGAAFSEDDIALFDSVGQLSGVVVVPNGVKLSGHLRVGLVWKRDNPGSEYPAITAGASTPVDMEAGEEDTPRFSVLVDPDWTQGTLSAKGTLVVFVDLDDDGALDLEESGACGDRVVGVAHNVVVQVTKELKLEVTVGTVPCFPDLNCKSAASLRPMGGKFGRPIYEGISISLDEDLVRGGCATTEPLAVYGHCYAARESLKRSVAGECPSGQPNCLATVSSPVGVFRLTQLQQLETMRIRGCCGFALGASPWFCSPSVGCPDGYVCCKDACKRSCPTSDRRVVRWPYVPPGEFVMGSWNGLNPYSPTDEGQSMVRLTRGFLIGSTEVTETEFFHVMSYLPPFSKTPNASLPINRLTWHEAAAFCSRLSELDGLPRCYKCYGEGDQVRCSEEDGVNGKGIYGCKGYRLPTEAEWEYAYRAGTSTTYYNGEMTDWKIDPRADEIAWYAGNVPANTMTAMPVACKLPNAYGLYDMSGNAEEWVHDASGDHEKHGDTSIIHIDPVTSENRVLSTTKGGGFWSDAWMVAGANRGAFEADSPHGGLRCGRSAD